ncbi:YciC family protein [Singulisphaera sp. PoT]|uniref:YciC family protein n=1 Tax=Singulisphaera sp. PoT TaxID=3411797 RepID=UPI003BF4A3D0
MISDGEAAETNPYAAPLTRASHDEDFGTIEGSFVHTSITAKVGEAFKLFGGNLGLISMIILTIWLPANLLIYFLESRTFDPESGRSLAGLANIVEGLFGPICVGAVIHLVSQRMAGHRVTYGEAMGVGLRNWTQLFGTRLLTGLFIILGLIALIVPGIILALRFALIDPIVILEGRSGREAQKRSQNLTTGYKLQIFLGGILSVLPIFIVAFLGGMVFALMPQLQNVITSSILGCALNVLGTILIITGYLIYRESAGLRSKKKPSPAQFVDI